MIRAPRSVAAPVLVLWLVLAACAPRGEITVRPDAAEVGRVETVFVATNRAIDPATGSFGPGRSETASFARFAIAVPPDREPGTIAFPRDPARADPRRDFLTVDRELYPDARAFRAALGEALRARPASQRDVVIYVHGFNNTFAEGLYRIAQLSSDLRAPAVAVHYSWPSLGNALGYVHDRDSMLLSRDGLEALIRDVSQAGGRRILLVGHSMGAALTMEALRQIAIRGDRRLLGDIDGVMLISPDIDVDVFRSQARAIGDLPEPFVIFGSNRDRWLSLSARLTGEQARLGNLTDVTAIADLRVMVLDVAAVGGPGHFAVGDSPALLNLLGQIGDLDQAFGRDTRGRTGLLPGVVLTVQNATQVVLAPVVALDQATRRRPLAPAAPQVEVERP